jgi:hypothetical protein
METRLPLLGLAAYARTKGPHAEAAAKAVDAAAEVFLRRKLYKRVSDGTVIRPDFVALHYPLYWHYDVLGGLKAMALIGRIRDRRCADSLDLLEEKRLPDGGWPAAVPGAASFAALRTFNRSCFVLGNPYTELPSAKRPVASRSRTRSPTCTARGSSTAT